MTLQRNPLFSMLAAIPESLFLLGLVSIISLLVSGEGAPVSVLVVCALTPVVRLEQRRLGATQAESQISEIIFISVTMALVYLTRPFL